MKLIFDFTDCAIRKSSFCTRDSHTISKKYFSPM